MKDSEKFNDGGPVPQAMKIPHGLFQPVEGESIQETIKRDVIKTHLQEPEALTHLTSFNGVQEKDSVSPVPSGSSPRDRRGSFKIDIDESPSYLIPIEPFKTVRKITVARNEEAFRSRKEIQWVLNAGPDYVADPIKGKIYFPIELNKPKTLEYIEAQEDYYYIFVEYTV